MLNGTGKILLIPGSKSRWQPTGTAKQKHLANAIVSEVENDRAQPAKTIKPMRASTSLSRADKLKHCYPSNRMAWCLTMTLTRVKQSKTLTLNPNSKSGVLSVSSQISRLLTTVQ